MEFSGDLKLLIILVFILLFLQRTASGTFLFFFNCELHRLWISFVDTNTLRE